MVKFIHAATWLIIKEIDIPLNMIQIILLNSDSKPDRTSEIINVE